MNEIFLYSLKLKTFTEQDVLDYCSINNINPDKITKLNLYDNELTDISGIKLFKNLEFLDISHNLIKDISVLNNLKNLKILILFNTNINNISSIQYLKNLMVLDIMDLKLESDQIKYIQPLKNIKKIWCKNRFKDMNIINELNKNIKIIKGMKYV